MKTNDIKLEEFYLTKDFEISGLLYAMGKKLDGHEWINGVCYFRFQDKTVCEKVVADFYNNKIKLNIKAVYDALRTIKGILRMG